MHVILDGEFGEVQASGDFLVRETAREERDQLLLPCRQAELSAQPLVQNHRTLPRSPRDELNQIVAKPRGADRFAEGYPANRGDHVLCAGFPKQIAADSRTHRLQECLRIIFHPEEDCLSSIRQMQEVWYEIIGKG